MSWNIYEDANCTLRPRLRGIIMEKSSEEEHAPQERSLQPPFCQRGARPPQVGAEMATGY